MRVNIPDAGGGSMRTRGARNEANDTRHPPATHSSGGVPPVQVTACLLLYGVAYGPERISAQHTIGGGHRFLDEMGVMPTVLEVSGE